MESLKSSILMTVAMAATFALTACPGPDPNGGDPGSEKPDAGHVVRCGDNACEGTETAASCPQDCHTQTGPVCGNNQCETGETAASCPADCAVCGDGVCSSTENGSSCPADCDAKLKVANASTYSIFYFYAAQCGATTWSADQLGANVISPNATWTLTNIPPGCWNFRADNSDHSAYWVTSSSVNLTAGETFTWTLHN